MKNLKKVLFITILMSYTLSGQEKSDVSEAIAGQTQVSKEHLHGKQAQEPHVQVLSTFALPGISVRAIEVTGPDTLWFAGSSGRYGRIVNDVIEMDSISHEGKLPQFRSIAYNGSYVFLLSIESPALLYRIDPKKPLGQYELVYQEAHPKAFYDALVFFDKDHGLAMGDPTDACLSVIRTSDGGASWTKLSCEELPESAEGEAAFAASNSNIAVIGKHAWIATGGSSARVFKSEDYGASWTVNETPIIQGGKMTGIFSIDFYDKNKGVIMGGNWEDKKDGTASKAVSQDGGLTWNLVGVDKLPGYISCVQYIPGGKGKQIMAVSTEGMYYSKDGGLNWVSTGTKGYYSIRMVDQQTAFVSTHEEIAKIKLNNL